MQYRPEIDGLRTLAVLPVVLFHAGVPFLAGGFVGVDIFFVISGYLITSIIYGELQTGSFTIGKFYERRVRRLLPALFVVLAATVAMALAWLPPHAAQDFFKSLIAVPLFGSNMYFSETSGYFSAASELKPLLHTWSLAVEEQYYLFFPIFMILFGRFGRRWLALLIGVGLLLSLAFAVLYVERYPERAFFNMPARCWELLIGAMAALHLADGAPSRLRKWQLEAASLAGFLLIAVTISRDPGASVPGFYSLLPTVGAVLIILFAREGTLVNRLLSLKPAVAIGLISYSLYLWHQPLMAFARYRSVGVHDPMLMTLAVLGSVALAWLTWRYVETPFRNRTQVPVRRLVPFAVAGSAFFIVVGAGAAFSDYTTLRYGSEKAALSKEIWSVMKPVTQCVQGYHKDKAEACLLGSKDAAKTLAVIGDSHAGQWTDALDQLGKERGVQVVVYAKAACASANVRYEYYALRREYFECETWRNDVLRQVKQRRFDAILVTTSSASYVQSVGLDNWKKGVADFVGALRPQAGQVFWMIDNPRYPSDPFMCFEANFWHGDGRNCSVARAEALDAGVIAAERAALAGLPAVRLIDFHDFFCDAQRCRAEADGYPLMRDTNHLTKNTTTLLQDRLAGHLGTAF